MLKKLLDIQSQKNEVQDYDQQVFEMSLGYRYECELGNLCQDRNQHLDDYPDKYFNYHAVPVTPQNLQKLENVTPIEKVWNLNDESIKFGLKLYRN